MIFEAIAEAAAEFLLYGTGRLLVPLLSLGAARSESWTSPSRTHGFKFWWREDQLLVLSDDATTFIGLLFWFSVGLLAYFLCR